MNRHGFPGPAALIEGQDVEVIPLVDAMNSVRGIYTIDSCSGHGANPVYIGFRGERQVAIAALLFWFNSCHSGERWEINAHTDCAGADLFFEVSSAPRIGEEAWASAQHIAACIRAGAFVPR